MAKSRYLSLNKTSTEIVKILTKREHNVCGDIEDVRQHFYYPFLVNIIRS